MQTPTSVEALAEWLRRRLQPRSPHLVGIDGVPRIGKSTLARALADQVTGHPIELDRLLTEGDRPYPQMVDCGALREEVDIAIEHNKPALIEGVLLLSVLKECGFQPDTHIYVRCPSRENHDLRTDDLFEPRSAQRLLSQANEIARIASIPDDAPVLEREVIRYHLEVRPHERAHLIYEPE